MEVIPFEIEHFDRMEVVEKDMLSRSYRDIYASYKGAGAAITLMINGVPVYCAGIAIRWDGCGDLWMLPSVHVKKYALSVVKCSRQMLDHYIDVYKLHRVQATVKAVDPVDNNFARHFGFELECVMRKYWTDKSDYNLYARIN